MLRHHRTLNRIAGFLFLLGPLAGFAMTGCSGMQPEPDGEGVGELQSPTHEQDALREDDRGEDAGRR